MKDLQIIRIFADGHREPDVPFGTIILLIQEGTVSTGKLCSDPTFGISIEHPKNSGDIDMHALDIVTRLKPNYLKGKESILVICPKELLPEIIW